MTNTLMLIAVIVHTNIQEITSIPATCVQAGCTNSNCLSSGMASMYSHTVPITTINVWTEYVIGTNGVKVFSIKE